MIPNNTKVHFKRSEASQYVYFYVAVGYPREIGWWYKFNGDESPNEVGPFDTIDEARTHSVTKPEVEMYAA
jgi:hypothetical protein